MAQTADNNKQAPDFGFPSSPNESLVQWREVLALIPARPKHKDDDVRAVAMALKTHGPMLESLFIEWAKKHGYRNHRAKAIWDRVKADPDAIEELLELHEAARTQKDRFNPLTAAILEAMPPQQWRIKGVFPIEGLAVVYGASTAGKSFLALEMAGSIGAGAPFFENATKAAPVLYVGLEGESGYRGRVIAWQSYHGRVMPDNVRFLLQPFRLTDMQDVSDLAAICPPGCVVFIDTLNRAAPGMDENSSRDMGGVIEGAKTLQRLTGGLVILVAHTGKDSAKGLRGHSSLFAALDAAVLVSRNGDLRSWKVDKAKDGKDGDEHRFMLNVVEVGADEDGEAITSCVVTPDNTPTLPGSGKSLTASQNFGLETYKEAAGLYGGLDDNGNFIGLHVDQWRKVFYQKSTADNDATKRKAFNRARKELVELNRLLVRDNIYRLDGLHAPIAESCIAEVLKAEAGHGTGAGQQRDMSHVATLPLCDGTGHTPLGVSHVTGDAIADWPLNNKPNVGNKL